MRKNEKTNKMLTIKSYIVASLFNDVVILSFPFQLESSSKQKKIAFFGPNKGHNQKGSKNIKCDIAQPTPFGIDFELTLMNPFIH